MTQPQRSLLPDQQFDTGSNEKFVQSVRCFIRVRLQENGRTVTKVLVGQIPENKEIEGGKWTLIGGKVDPEDENSPDFENDYSPLKAAIVREVREELGYEIAMDQLELVKLITSSVDHTQKGKVWSIFYFAYLLNFSQLTQDDVLRVLRLQMQFNLKEIAQIALIDENDIVDGDYPIAFDQQQDIIVELLRQFNEA